MRSVEIVESFNNNGNPTYNILIKDEYFFKCEVLPKFMSYVKGTKDMSKEVVEERFLSSIEKKNVIPVFKVTIDLIKKIEREIKVNTLVNNKYNP